MAPDPLALAVLTWSQRREGWRKPWGKVSIEIPPEAGARVMVVLLREFCGCRLTPADVSIVEEDQKEFRYSSDSTRLTLKMSKKRR